MVLVAVCSEGKCVGRFRSPIDHRVLRAASFEQNRSGLRMLYDGRHDRDFASRGLRAGIGKCGHAATREEETVVDRQATEIKELQ
jgi:hypothetical protein